MRKINLTIDRIRGMADWEMSTLSDRYVKNRLSRFAVDPDVQSILDEREAPRESRSPDYEEVFADVKKQIHDLLYSPEVIQRHLIALEGMERNVETQLEQNDDDDSGWRNGAKGFLNLVKDEIARVQAQIAEFEEDSAQEQLEVLLQAIKAHAEAEDADEADDRLYAIAHQIEEAMFNV